MTLAWHALLAPWPEEERPVRALVAGESPEASRADSPIAGWTQLTLERSAGSDGHRVTQLVLDADGRPISASDWVVRRVERDALVEHRHESIGGRIEPDGSFRGTRWRGVTIEGTDGEVVSQEMLPSKPSEGEADALLALVRDLVRRAGISIEAA